MRTVRKHEIGRVFFWMGFSCDSDIHIRPGIGLHCFFYFLNLFEKDTLPISIFLTVLICFVFVFNLIVRHGKAKTTLPVLLTVLCASVVK